MVRERARCRENSAKHLFERCFWIDVRSVFEQRVQHSLFAIRIMRRPSQPLLDVHDFVHQNAACFDELEQLGVDPIKVRA